MFFIWELPQLLLGAVWWMALRKNIVSVVRYKGTRIFLVKKLKGGISLS